ncbi:DEAD/DEAH box helicase [Saccharopolyspora pogona]|uniref:DEAD/DEAH box helicase n=1 Tax=Saccharopolyspora pogona TaxID=333966 RepID=UPI001CC24234|nr:DEAD/DEAH box helicase [Saccharopolyspora pogona]
MTESAVEAAAGGKAKPSLMPGAQVRIRDEQWLIRKVTPTRSGEHMITVIGMSSFVRGTEAVFYSELEDEITTLDPKKTQLVGDDSPHHRRARLFLEAVIRKTALPQTEQGLALSDAFLLKRQRHQLRPAELALSMRNARPRILIGDVVGLGKTIEIGLLLAELIRRGRGERILVVTPAQVLEQFQREMWTRFSIPLVRLDGTGIERVQREIPAGRNPFAYFKRAIISVDTLKRDQYRAYLDRTEWDTVVIDECHNVVNKRTDNNRLARRLAGHTDALILASATPHNGKPESFAELIDMLDEAAIADPTNYDVKKLDHLYIRRTKTAKEVRDSLTGSWAPRGPSLPVKVKATDKERAVLAELAEHWIPRATETSSVSAHQLLPYRLFKSFLSSHRALTQTIETRIQTLAKKAKEAEASKKKPDPTITTETEALTRLQELTAKITDSDSAKRAGLVEVLRELGVGPGSDVRVVIFSESIPTLTWLAETVPAKLGFPRTTSEDEDKPWRGFHGAVEVMHGQLTTDDEDRSFTDRFGLRDDPLRLLFTGDVASEGVNLHQQCHQLIHYDLPWSLIRIEQRNGRIDRYGQAVSPEFRAIVLTADVAWRTDPETGEELPLDDHLVGRKLLEREEEAHRIEGSVEQVSGLYSGKEEEDRLTQDLIAGRTVDQSLRASRKESQGFMAAMYGNIGAAASNAAEVRTASVPTLFDSTESYFDEALRQICPMGPEQELTLRRESDGTIGFEPPADLRYRLRALPQSYLDEQGILPTTQREGRLRITFKEKHAQEQLQRALDSSGSQWPYVGFVSPLHPVVEWVTDKALASLRYDEAFVLAYRPDHAVATEIDGYRESDFEGPIFLVQGGFSNASGRPTVVEWMAIVGLPDTPRVLRVDNRFLTACGVGPEMSGRAEPIELDRLKRLVPLAIDEAERHLRGRHADYAKEIGELLAPHCARVKGWQEELFRLTRSGTQKHVRNTVAELEKLAENLTTSGEPLLRLLAVLEPLSAKGTTR